MKRLFFITAAIASFALLGACGSMNNEETEEQKRIQDSLNEIDRNASLDDAERLLREQDSIAKYKEDSAAAVAVKK